MIEPPAGQVQVRVDSGYLAGVSTGEKGAVFLGVPFAAAPIGNLRWRPPNDVKPWTGVRTATSFAPACVQGSYTTDWYAGVIEDFGSNPALAARPVSESEDCLYLNIWTPNLDGGANLPVMVWIHGGGYSGGWSYEPNYIGEKLAARGVIVVSIAYRLGPFGYFGPDDGANFGLMDQTKALNWVQNNIQSFGGDPENVTIFGESAGAASIGTLMVTPKAEGLFKRAIHQSGGFEFIEQTTSRDMARSFAKLESNLPTAETRAATSQHVFDISQTALPDQWYTPAQDGDWLPETPASLLEQGKVHAVDLMIGTNVDEWLMYIDTETVDEQIRSWKTRLPDANDLIDELVSDQGEVGALDRLETAHQMRCPGQDLARSVSEKNRAVFFYRFSRVRPSEQGAKIGSYHGAEIPYIFDTHDSWLPTEEPDRILTDQMMSAWVAFASEGDPNAAVSWPEFGTTGQLLEFGNTIELGLPWDAQLCPHLSAMESVSAE